MTKKKLPQDKKYYKIDTSNDTESDNYSSSNESEDSNNTGSTSNTESSSKTESSSSDSSTDDCDTRLQVKQKLNIIPVIKPKKMLKSGDIFKELIKYQIKNIPARWKLNVNDMKRICKYIDTSIFDPNCCCIWKGYITNANNSNKGTYVNFYFKNKKVALHRLLYSNFVAPLDSSEYLKFNCDNKGVCCNVNHYEKYKYSKKNGSVKKEKSEQEKKKESKEVIIIGADENDKLIIDFD